ncbi:MAG: FecR domain-containing protein [Treponema sp.]|jgi:hypothetical protein|nr:FecR domain-containing protein [Treponema sp.]
MKILCLSMALIVSAGALYGQSPRAFIQEIRGTVEVKEPGSSVWTAATLGQGLTQDSQISTGFKSSALIKLGDATILAKPLTRLSLAEIQTLAETERVDVQLRAGRVRAEVNPPAGRTVSFNLRGPTATASVRGTAFEFDTINLQVNEGVVHFSGSDNTAVYVRAGQSSAAASATGQTAVPVETVEARTPPPPAGVENISVPAVVIPVSTGSLTVNITWEE